MTGDNIMQIYKSNANLRIANNVIRMGAFRIAEARRAKARCSHAGFSLIELLIAMTIFSIVITAALGLFSSAFRFQKISLDSAYLLNNASYITEYVSRALRMAKKDIGGICITSKYNFENPGGDTSRIRFLNYYNECQEFYLAEGGLKVEKEGIGQDLTSADLTIENLHFAISGESQADKIQPKVSFNLKLKNNEQQLDFQTTVSQRDLDVKY